MQWQGNANTMPSGQKRQILWEIFLMHTGRENKLRINNSNQPSMQCQCNNANAMLMQYHYDVHLKFGKYPLFKHHTDRYWFPTNSYIEQQIKPPSTMASQEAITLHLSPLTYPKPSKKLALPPREALVQNWRSIWNSVLFFNCQTSLVTPLTKHSENGLNMMPWLLSTPLPTITFCTQLMNPSLWKKLTSNSTSKSIWFPKDLPTRTSSQ